MAGRTAPWRRTRVAATELEGHEAHPQEPGGRSCVPGHFTPSSKSSSSYSGLQPWCPNRNEKQVIIIEVRRQQYLWAGAGRGV